ncbi:MAG: hypothetical protein ACI8QC_003489 [Planctomycetota bacterium]|jgi:hypothetical protein
MIQQTIRVAALAALLATSLTACIEESRREMGTVAQFDSDAGLTLPGDTGVGTSMDASDATTTALSDSTDTGDTADSPDTGDTADTADSPDTGDTDDTADSPDTGDTDDTGDSTDRGDTGEVETADSVLGPVDILECQVAADCPISDLICHAPLCESHQCVYLPVPVGTHCEGADRFNNVCDDTVWYAPDQCNAAGACVESKPIPCTLGTDDAGGVCMIGTCVAAHGCVEVPVPAGMHCGAPASCQEDVWQDAATCDGAGGCVESEPTRCTLGSDDTAGVCTIGACVAAHGCVEVAAPAGTQCGDAASCQEGVWEDAATCNGAGGCDAGEVSACPSEPCLSECWEGVDPAVVGCADGSREGFTDKTSYPDVASCGGAWSVPGVFQGGPACGRNAGNHGENAAGAGCNVQDLCAEGWSICSTISQVTTHMGEGGCDDAVAVTYPNYGTGPIGVDEGGVLLDITPGGAFFVTAVTGNGTGRCADEPSAHDDAFGCGNLGRRSIASTCGGLNRFSGNLCGGLRSYYYVLQDNPANDFGYETAEDWAWSCSGAVLSRLEPDTIVKTKADQQGGVMCCRD